MSRITGLLWKITAVVIAALLGLICANQAGWNGADVALNFKETGLIGDFLESLMFLVSFGICYGAILFVKWIAKPLLWVMVPMFLYAAIVPGMVEWIQFGIRHFAIGSHQRRLGEFLCFGAT